MDYFKRAQMKDIGPGGWKCRCCGPAPKHRPKVRRRGRSRVKVATRDRVTEVL